MIQELRTLLLNDNLANNFLLIPSSFFEINLSKIESNIRSVMLDASTSSVEYKCFAANKLCSAVYRDSEFNNILASQFDGRNYFSKEEDVSLRSSSRLDKNEIDVVVDLRNLVRNKKSRNISYNFSIVHGENNIVATGGYDNSVQHFELTEEEILGSSLWKTLDDSGVRVKFNLPSSYVNGFEIIDGGSPPSSSINIVEGGIPESVALVALNAGGPVFPNIALAIESSISVSVPFYVNFGSMLESLISIEGLIDFMYLVGESHPEIIQKFNDDTRKDRKLFSILLAYGISVKQKNT